MNTLARLPAVVLAGERPGGNALARSHDVAAGVLVEVLGRPCLARVLDALRASDRVGGGVVVGPRREVVDGDAALRALLEAGDFRWLPPADGPSASAMAGVAALARWPVLLTAGDHALLTPAIVDDFCTRADRLAADVVIGLVPWARVRAAWPESRRTLLRFADGACCGSNLFLLRSARATAVLDFWRAVERERKRPWRIARALGAGTLLRYLGGRLERAEAFARLSAQAGAEVACITIDEPRAAVDVDSAADHALAERILAHD
ncbi:MAG: NTP transferase domain-containing protein [Gammaproteobacteria bacterium]|nr:nucleotidyltransferase family protein [Gammaproteobacteria bacterium]MCP5201210.1 NTP transferase domain-containing protein [Gammaproteobacteria bacterium]